MAQKSAPREPLEGHKTAQDGPGCFPGQVFPPKRVPETSKLGQDASKVPPEDSSIAQGASQKTVPGHPPAFPPLSSTGNWDPIPRPSATSKTVP